MTGSLQPVFVKSGIEADDEAVLDPVGRGTQIAARPHRLLQDGVPAVGRRDQVQHLLALGDANAAGRLQQLPGGIAVKTDGLRVDNFSDIQLFFLKKLLSIFAGRSAFTQIGPVDRHLCLLFLRGCQQSDKVYTLAKRMDNAAALLATGKGLD